MNSPTEQMPSNIKKDCPCGYLSRNGFKSRLCWACYDDDNSLDDDAYESNDSSKFVDPTAEAAHNTIPHSYNVSSSNSSLVLTLVINGKEVSQNVNVMTPTNLRNSPYYGMPKVNVGKCIDGAIQTMLSGRTGKIRLTSKGLYCSHGNKCRSLTSNKSCTRVLHTPIFTGIDDEIFTHLAHQAFPKALYFE